MSRLICVCPGYLEDDENEPCDEVATQEDFLCDFCRTNETCKEGRARERVSQTPAQEQADVPAVLV